MRIRKAFQGTIPENKILDTYSNSNTDTYSCNYINTKANTYSTDETAIGKWIDGKTIYRKTDHIGAFSTGSDKIARINTTLPSNFDKIISIKFIYNIQRSWYSNWEETERFMSGTQLIVIFNTANYQFEDSYLTLEYTKNE